MFATNQGFQLSLSGPKYLDTKRIKCPLSQLARTANLVCLHVWECLFPSRIPLSRQRIATQHVAFSQNCLENFRKSKSRILSKETKPGNHLGAPFSTIDKWAIKYLQRTSSISKSCWTNSILILSSINYDLHCRKIELNFSQNQSKWPKFSWIKLVDWVWNARKE